MQDKYRLSVKVRLVAMGRGGVVCFKTTPCDVGALSLGINHGWFRNYH